MDIIAFVSSKGPDGVHLMGLQAYMTILHGNRRDRVVEMVNDLVKAGYLRVTEENMVKLTGQGLPPEWAGNE